MPSTSELTPSQTEQLTQIHTFLNALSNQQYDKSILNYSITRAHIVSVLPSWFLELSSDPQQSKLLKTPNDILNFYWQSAANEKQYCITTAITSILSTFFSGEK